MKVLFICNGNVARSQEAAAYFNAMTNSPEAHAQSAGIQVKIGKPIDPLVIKVMAEDGMSLAHATRKLISEEMVRTADLIVSFKAAEELPPYTRQSNVIFWQVPDPQHQDVAFHRATRDQVKQLVRQLITDLARSNTAIPQ